MRSPILQIVSWKQMSSSEIWNLKLLWFNMKVQSEREGLPKMKIRLLKYFKRLQFQTRSGKASRTDYATLWNYKIRFHLESKAVIGFTNFTALIDSQYKVQISNGA